VKGHFIVYGVSDCPACLKACASLMELHPSYEYSFVNMDFAESYRNRIKEKYNHRTYPIIVFEYRDQETLVGGFLELTRFVKDRTKYSDYSAPQTTKNKEPN